MTLLVTTAVVQQFSEGPGLRTLTWVDRNGGEEPLPLEPAVCRVARVSPDGRRIALDRGRPGNREVWIFEVETGTLARWPGATATTSLRSGARTAAG